MSLAYKSHAFDISFVLGSVVSVYLLYAVFNKFKLLLKCKTIEIYLKPKI